MTVLGIPTINHHHSQDHSQTIYLTSLTLSMLAWVEIVPWLRFAIRFWVGGCAPSLGVGLPRRDWEWLLGVSIPVLLGPWLNPDMRGLDEILDSNSTIEEACMSLFPQILLFELIKNSALSCLASLASFHLLPIFKLRGDLQSSEST